MGDKIGVARRKRKGDYHHGDLRKALSDAAWATLERDGVDRLSLRELAHALGVSYAAPSHHFRDKEGLLDELRRMAWTRFADTLESALAGEGAALREVGHAYVGFALAHPHALELMFRPNAQGPTADVLAQSMRAWGLLLQAVGKQLGPERSGDARALAACAVAASAQVHGLSMLWSRVTLPPEMRDPGAAAALQAGAIDVVLAGIDAVGPPARRRGAPRDAARAADEAPSRAGAVRSRRPGRRDANRWRRRSPRPPDRRAAR